MKSIRNLGQRLNTSQRNIVAVSVGLVFFIIAFSIAEGQSAFSSAFDMDDTGGIWLIFAAATGYFMFHLFSDKKD